MDIDFVICWVDGSDVSWQKKLCRYRGQEWHENAFHYRDWNLLRYWFRAVEEYAPWVHRVFFVTDGQCPCWLYRDNPKLVLVDHKDYIPSTYLPTFNSNCIEFNFHRIEGLSEFFVAFNDDMFLNNYVKPEYYFREGVPADATLEHVFGGQGYQKDAEGWGIALTEYCNIQVLNAYFNRKEVVANNMKGWYGSYLSNKYRLNAYLIRLFGRTEFQHFYTPHNEKAFLKSIFEELWDLEPTLMEKTCSRFREVANLNIYLMRLWQLASNKFYPTPFRGKKVFPISEENMPLIKQALFDENVTSLCLNDSSYCKDDFYPQAKEMLFSWYEKKLPKKSSFEK